MIKVTVFLKLGKFLIWRGYNLINVPKNECVQYFFLIKSLHRRSETALEEGPAPARVQIPDGEYKAACRWVCKEGVCELYC